MQWNTGGPLAMSWLVAACAVLTAVGSAAAPANEGPPKAAAVRAKGPLRVHPRNPRFFTDGSGRAVFLTGSHTWGNLCDYPPSRWPPFDYEGYLGFLVRYRHNFIRLWAGDSLECRPCRYTRPGPGLATDGEPKVDVSRLNQEYFDRLRARVVAARDRGIYVGIMLFHADVCKREDWPGHLFNPANNIRGLNGDPNGDGFGAEAYDLSVPEITRSQEAFVRKAIDTVNDLDNVLYEIGNEGDLTSVAWQNHLIRFIKSYQAGKRKQHPVGMTAVFNIVGGNWATDNKALFDSPADWVSPGLDAYKDDPPAADGRKVIVADVDHIWPKAPHRKWIWKCLLRGLHPILMDQYSYGKPEWTPEEEQEAMRRCMGHARTVADRVDLAAMAPRGELASTGYCLADPGREYLAYLPDGGEVTVDVSAARGTLAVEWIHPVDGTRTPGGQAEGGAKRAFQAPFNGDAVLHLQRR